MSSSVKPEGFQWVHMGYTPPEPSELWAYPISEGGTVNLETGDCEFPYGAVLGSKDNVSGDVTLTEPNSTYENKNVDGRIFINANNITLSNVICEAVRVHSSVSQAYIDDCSIVGPGGLEAGITYANYRVRRTEITNVFDGLKAFGNVEIEDCYVHDMDRTATDGNTGGGYAHGDGLQTGGGQGLTIRNSYFNNVGENAGIFIFRDAAGGYGDNPIADVVIDGVTTRYGGNFGFWIEETSDGGISEDQWVPQNVEISNLFLGPANPLQYNLSGTPSSAPTWRRGGRIYFPTKTFTPVLWDNVKWSDPDGVLTSVAFGNVDVGGDYYGVQITP